MKRSEEQPKFTLERSPHRCKACPWARALDEEARPRLAVARLNGAAKSELAVKTAEVPQDQHVCLNVQCGAAFHALGLLEPLQKLLEP